MPDNVDCLENYARPVTRRARCGSFAAVLLAAPMCAADSSPPTQMEPAHLEASTSGSCDGPLVEVEQGWLRGVSDEERAGGERRGGAPVDEFLGIPFAAPPLADLRFEPPRPSSSWPGVRDARQSSVICAQRGTPSTEDCLYLNIYRPRGIQGKLPVLFYIHGGSLMVGSASEFRARKLASEIPAVVVTTNYRLNVFGFLTLPPSGSNEPDASASTLSGNYGLLDQQAALGWVQRNIWRFGGDASRVTLAGHSSGGTSVCAHLASPPAWGSFSGAMVQSADCVSVERDVSESRSMAFASGLGCTDPATAAACLRALPTDSLVSGLGGFQADFSVDPALLPVGLPRAFKTGDIARVPTLIGTTHDELRIFLSALYPLAAAQYAEMLERSFPGFAAQVAELYPADAYPDPLYAYSAALSDAVTNCPTRQTAAQLSQLTATYYYEFDDPNAPAPHWMPVPPGFVMGSTHSSDAPYIFDRDGLVQPDAAPFDSAQLALGRELRQAIGAFLRAGDPSLPAGPSWPAYEPETDRVMLLQPGGLNVTRAYEQRHHCDFWASVPAAVL